MTFQDLTSEARSTIVGALQTVDGIAPYETAPDTPVVNDAWPVLLDVRPITMAIAETDWHVYVALPAGDMSSTVDGGDDVIDPVANALMVVAKVTHIRPARWPLDSGSEIPVWQFEITI